MATASDVDGAYADGDWAVDICTIQYDSSIQCVSARASGRRPTVKCVTKMTSRAMWQTPKPYS